LGDGGVGRPNGRAAPRVGGRWGNIDGGVGRPNGRAAPPRRRRGMGALGGPTAGPPPVSVGDGETLMGALDGPTAGPPPVSVGDGNIGGGVGRPHGRAAPPPYKRRTVQRSGLEALDGPTAFMFSSDTLSLYITSPHPYRSSTYSPHIYCPYIYSPRTLLHHLSDESTECICSPHIFSPDIFPHCPGSCPAAGPPPISVGDGETLMGALDGPTAGPPPVSVGDGGILMGRWTAQRQGRPPSAKYCLAPCQILPGPLQVLLGHLSNIAEPPSNIAECPVKL
jgi:hypothetical protein